MAVKAKAELVGIEDLERFLNNMPKEFQGTVLNSAIKEASKPLLEAAKRNLASAPYGAHLVRMIRQVSRKVAGLPGQEIGAMPTKRKRRSEAVWEDMGAYWLEFGTMEMMTKPREPRTRSLAEAQRRVGAGRRGRIPANAWLRRAVDTTEEEIEQKFRGILWKKFNQRLRRDMKRGKIRMVA